MPTTSFRLTYAHAVQAPDGSTWQCCTSGSIGGSPTVLVAMTQNPDTRQWHTDPTRKNRLVPQEEFEATYTVIEREPLRDARITRLAQLVGKLLTEFEARIGRPAACAEQITQAVADVEAIPEEAAQRSHARAVQARRTGFHHGSQR